MSSVALISPSAHMYERKAVTWPLWPLRRGGCKLTALRGVFVSVLHSHCCQQAPCSLSLACRYTQRDTAQLTTFICLQTLLERRTHIDCKQAHTELTALLFTLIRFSLPQMCTHAHTWSPEIQITFKTSSWKFVWSHILLALTRHSYNVIWINSADAAMLNNLI